MADIGLIYSVQDLMNIQELNNHPNQKIMQTKYRTQLMHLKLSAIQKIGEIVQKYGGEIPYNDGKQIDSWNLFDKNANATPLHDLSTENLAEIADYCLNYIPDQNDYILPANMHYNFVYSIFCHFEGEGVTIDNLRRHVFSILECNQKMYSLSHEQWEEVINQVWSNCTHKIAN